MNRRNVLLLGLVSFINDTGSKMVLPVLPLFLQSLGGSGLAVGLIGGVGETIAAFFKVFSGNFSDRIGRRKPFVLVGYAISALSKFLLAFSVAWPHVLLLRSTERLGKGLRQSPRDALLASSTERSVRGKGFGIHRALDSGGAVLGSLAVLFLFWFFAVEFRSIFLIAGIISFVSLLPIFIVREKKFAQSTKALRVSLRALPSSLRVFIFIATIFAFANFSYMFFVLRSSEFFSGSLGVVIPIAMYAVFQLVSTIFAVPAGMLSDRIGRKKVLFFGYFLFSIVCFGFVFFNSFNSFVFLFFLYGVFFAFVDATERAFVSDLVSEGTRGTALGTFQAFTGLAMLPGGIIAGFAWDFFGSNATFVYGAIVSLLAVVLLWIFSYCKKL